MWVTKPYWHVLQKMDYMLTNLRWSLGWASKTRMLGCAGQSNIGESTLISGPSTFYWRIEFFCWTKRRAVLLFQAKVCEIRRKKHPWTQEPWVWLHQRMGWDRWRSKVAFGSYRRASKRWTIHWKHPDSPCVALSSTGETKWKTNYTSRRQCSPTCSNNHTKISDRSWYRCFGLACIHARYELHWKPLVIPHKSPQEAKDRPWKCWWTFPSAIRCLECNPTNRCACPHILDEKESRLSVAGPRISYQILILFRPFFRYFFPLNIFFYLIKMNKHPKLLKLIILSKLSFTFWVLTFIRLMIHFLVCWKKISLFGNWCFKTCFSFYCKNCIFADNLIWFSVY